MDVGRVDIMCESDKPAGCFFPYKASMWDSLESVYLVAKEDSDCDVYCVPISYYILPRV